MFEKTQENYNPNQPTRLELPKEDFPYIFYSINVTLIVAVIYFPGSGILSEYIFGDDGMSAMAYVNAASQILFLLSPIILASIPIPLKLKILFRLDQPLDIKILSLSFLALISFQFFVSGYAGLQELLIPESLMDDYIHFNKLINELYETLLGGDTLLSFLKAIMIGAVVPAFCEEAVFRGFLQKSLEQKLKPIYAIVISGSLFGLIHLNPIDMIPLILIGIFLGYLAFISGSLLIPIIIHFANNAFAISIFYLSDTDLSGSSPAELTPALSAIFCFGGLLITLYICFLIYKARKSDTMQA